MRGGERWERGREWWKVDIIGRLRRREGKRETTKREVLKRRKKTRKENKLTVEDIKIGKLHRGRGKRQKREKVQKLFDRQKT